MRNADGSRMRHLFGRLAGQEIVITERQEIVIVGDAETAEIVYHYFTHDSPYRVAGFSVERKYLSPGKEVFGLPVVPFEELEEHFDPRRYKAFVAISYGQLNRVRTRLYKETKAKGFQLVSYISSKARLWDVEIGENCLITEANTLMYKVKIKDNVMLWNGNHIGHRTVIRDNVWVSSGVVISGFCDIGENSFLGVNCCFNDGVKVAKDCIIGSGAVVIADTEERKVYVGNPAKPGRDSFEAFGVIPVPGFRKYAEKGPVVEE